MYDEPDIYRLSGDSTIRGDELHDLLNDVNEYVDSLKATISDSDSPSEVHDACLQLATWTARHGDALKELRNITDEVGTDQFLIRDDIIDDHLTDEVNECYQLPKDLPSFVTLQIDYDVLKQDYSCTDFQGHTYWWRAR